MFRGTSKYIICEVKNVADCGSDEEIVFKTGAIKKNLFERLSNPFFLGNDKFSSENAGDRY